VTFASGYSGIYAAASALVSYINGYNFAPGEPLNIIAHSHGGNVVKIASWLMKPTINNFIALGTPNNFDLEIMMPGRSTNYCNVASLTDLIQVAGASPSQVFYIGYYTTQATREEFLAWDALLHGTFEQWAYHFGLAGVYFAEAAYWYGSTKFDIWANRNVPIESGSHGDLHTVPVWKRIERECGLR
jgi:hypothetical protein